jgi:hypothetical protein
MIESFAVTRASSQNREKVMCMSWPEELVRAVRDVLSSTPETARLIALLLSAAGAAAVFLIVYRTVKG